MRGGFLTTWLAMVVAAAGCGSSAPSAADASRDGASLCAHAPGVDCSASSQQTSAGFCSLGMGVQSACSPCGPPDAGQPCDQVVLVHGTQYTYLESLGIDTGTVYVYDANGTLVAQLFWYPGGWSCAAGPADFDSSEAESVFPFASTVDQHTMCPIDVGSAS